MEHRRKLIQDLDLFIDDNQNVLNNVLQQLKWKEESLMDEIKVPCESNAGHWIPQSSLSHHQEFCEWIEEGYVKEEFERKELDSSLSSKIIDGVTSVVIDATTQERILSECGLLRKDQVGTLNFPKTIDRWTVQLNPEQRLAVYDYIVKTAQAVGKQPKNVTLEDLMIDFEKRDEQEEKPKSQLEILAEMRDYKRRRQSYRAKNVHITKKSYTEIMKEVIENQTSYLAETQKCESSQKRKTDSEICDDQSDEEAKLHSYGEDYKSGSSSRHKKKHSDHTESREVSKRYSKHESTKKKKHKNRSRSRSPSRHKHKKSHHKRKRSYDSE